MMEQSNSCRSMERYSVALFVRNTRDRDLLHPNLACSNGGRNSFCLCDNNNPGIIAVKVILVQVYNVVAAVFYVFGKVASPVHRTYKRNCYLHTQPAH